MVWRPTDHPRQWSSGVFRCFVCCLDASADYRMRLTDAGIEHADLECPTLVRPGSILGIFGSSAWSDAFNRISCTRTASSAMS